MPSITFWYEFASTYSYPAACRVETVAAAQALGLFGAPMLTTDDDEVFWGNDRIEEAVAWASSAR